jgi:hypothetical protein
MWKSKIALRSGAAAVVATASLAAGLVGVASLFDDERSAPEMIVLCNLYSPSDLEVLDALANAAAAPARSGVREPAAIETMTTSTRRRTARTADVGEWVGLEEFVDTYEPGDCTLELRLVDAADARPLESIATLWRLDAPESAYWTAGDQPLFEGSIPVDGLVLRELPTGRYRVVTPAAAFDAKDAPPFELDVGSKSLTLPVRLPQREPIVVHAHDENGEAIERLEVATTGTETRQHSNRDRSWTRPRLPKPGWLEVDLEMFQSSQCGFGCGRGVYSPRLGGPSGIEVARSMIDDQRTASERWLRLRAVGSAMDYSHCDLETDGRSRGRDREFIGLFVRRERILQCIVLPDGADPSSLGTHLDFHVRAIPRSRARTTERWRDVPITLRISDPRYEPLRETFTLHRGFPRFELRARSAAKWDEVLDLPSVRGTPRRSRRRSPRSAQLGGRSHPPSFDRLDTIRCNQRTPERDTG